MTQSSSFTPGVLWLDHNGVHINAHGGGILFHQGTYYWYGEHKIAGSAGNRAHVGVHCYSSSDLYNWQDQGIALKVSQDPQSDITKGCVLERPKVIYNARTGKFVMWFHLELLAFADTYQSARCGIAIADAPTGPFTFVRSLRPNPGYFPLNAHPDQNSTASIRAAAAIGEGTVSYGENPQTPTINLLGRDVPGGQQTRDMTLFVDDDGCAYHIYSSEWNSTTHIARLTDDYLDHTGEYVRAFENRWMEAPAIFKHQGKYYFLGSGCTSWAPNAARSGVADHIFGPWRELGNPCHGTNPHNHMDETLTFGGQSTYILPIQGKADAFIAMFDEWRPDNAIDGRYYWLPIEFTDGSFSIRWHDEWNLNTFVH